MLAVVHNNPTEKLDDENIEGRLDYVKFLLVQTNDPLGLIAVNCGWADERSLTEFFQAMVGVTPARYREWHRG